MKGGLETVDLALRHRLDIGYLYGGFESRNILLNSMDLKNLVAFDVRMYFSPIEWLRQDIEGKSYSRPLLRDFGSTNLLVYRHFHVAETNLIDVRWEINS